MPVHFKGSSEYHEQYKPLQSSKSAAFTPQPEQAARPAGQYSAKLGISVEPPLQHKKRCSGPPVSLSQDFLQLDSPASDDYALLGVNDKFVPNVRYKASKRGVSPPKQQKLSQKKLKENTKPVVAKSYPAPVVNTAMYRQNSAEQVTTPLAPRKPKPEPTQAPAAVTEQKSEPKQKVTTEPPAPKFSAVNKTSTKGSKKEDVNKQFFTYKAPLKDKNVNNMNEFVQTNMEKGVADSAPEAPAEYAMKYKAGIAAPRPKRKVSEYSKSFDWKIGGKSSPLLAAEQVVYNSNPQVAPFKSSVIPKKSEYNAQFKAWKPSAAEEKLKDSIVSDRQGRDKKRSSSKIKRSKSAGALSPDKLPPAGSAPLVTSDDKRLTRENEGTDQKPVPPTKHGQLRRTKSEYSNNFKSPAQFDYVKGAWKGASPPHLYASQKEDVGGEPKLSSWFAEVIELRRKAQEYRKRAQGTHFSREHLVQLMAQQNGAWDLQSTARSSHSTLSALSLEVGSARLNENKNSARATMASGEQVHEEDLELDLEEEDIEQRKLAWDESDSAYTASVYDDEDAGRIPTPEWKKRQTKKKTRHHLDLTTPAVGGALLSSPPQVSKSKKRAKRPPSDVAKSLPLKLQDIDECEGTATVTEPVHKPIAGQTKVIKKIGVTEGNIGPTPTFGMPSRDTHCLRDDDTSVDQPLQTNYVHSPLKDPRYKGLHMLSTIKEGFGQTYSSPTNVNVDGGQLASDEDDVLSISARSVASSCSVASQTLERARKRKEEFWGKNGIAAR